MATFKWLSVSAGPGFRLPRRHQVRKLEFLLADAVRAGADCLVTLGGLQSNHCRATAAAAVRAGLDCFLILRAPDPSADPGLRGNLLLDRLFGAQIRLVSPERYSAEGSDRLGLGLVEELRAAGRRPYLIPVGGSNSLGTWGYIAAVGELERQIEAGAAGDPRRRGFDHVVVACGSGGTAAGLGLGLELSGLSAELHGVGVCDSPEVRAAALEPALRSFPPR